MAADDSHDDRTHSFVNLTADTTVSHYKIIEKIGSGGMGEVYLAKDTKLKRQVALKFLPPHLCQDDDCRKRFRREAQAAAKLDHPNIVPVYEVGEFSGRPFFAMAHVEGKSLRDLIEQGKLSIPDAVGLARQVCEGLQRAHESGVVHRDVKPSNIIVDSENRARILDFGLATISGEKKLTKTGSTLGTVGYTSPEQVQGGTVDHRSDLFSVGVILYEMITGRTPFDAEHEAAIHYNIVHEDPEPLARYKSGVGGELQQIIDKALSKDVSLRYQHADGMLADLKRLQLEKVAKPKGRLGLWVAAVVILVAVIGLLLLEEFGGTTGHDGTGWDNSVAVLVFRNLSSDTEQDYFCEGMTDEIIGRLSTIKNLKVTSMQSMLRFKGTDLDLKKIGKELGVANVLEGNIQMSGDNIRVRAQLIRVEDDAHIWTEKYDRVLQEVFAIQDEISQSIADVLETRLIGGGITIVSRHGTDDIEAYNAYVRGRHFWRKRTDENLVKAIEQFEIAIGLDPDYAQAWSGLADAWGMRPGYGNVTQKIAYPKADSTARRALELGPQLAEAHTSWANFLRYRRDRAEESEQAFLKALELNPGYSWAHMWYGLLLNEMGRDPSLVLHHWTVAYELDPVSLPALGNMSYYFRWEGDYDEAVKYCRRQIELEPSFYPAYRNLAWSYVNLGDTGLVYQTLDSMMHYAPEVWQAHANNGELLAQLGRMEEAESAYRKGIELAPDNWQPYDRLGNFLTASLGGYQEAEACFKRAIALDSTQPAPHSGYGHNLRLQGRVDEMIEQNRLAMELAPYDPEVYRAYGWAIGPGLRKYDEAIKYMQKALKLNPRHTRTLNSISLMYASAGQFDEAFEAINKSIELDRGDLFPFRRKADIFVMAGKYDSARVWYGLYNESRSTDSYVLQRLGYINSQLGDYRAADSFFNSLCNSADPSMRASGRRNAVTPHVYQGQIKAAIEELEAGIRIDSLELGNCREMLWKLFNIIDLKLLFSLRHDSTLTCVARAEKLNNALASRTLWQDAAILGFEALALAYSGDQARGTKMLEDALDNPEFVSPYVVDMLKRYLARAYLVSDRSDVAVDLMRPLVAVDSSFRNQMFLGYAYLHAEKPDDAIATLEQALATWDEDRLTSATVEQTLAVYYLGQAYERAGRTTDAIEQYETFLDIWKNADEGLESVVDAKAKLAKLKQGS